MTGMVTDLGAKPTSVPFSELFSCFNTGVIDGADQTAVNYRSNAFQEVAPYLLLDGHTAGVTQILISDKAWAKLNEQQRLWVMEAAQYASQMCIKNAAAVEQNVVTQLQNEGITVTYVSDKAPWRAACQPTIQQASAGQENLYQQILALQ